MLAAQVQAVEAQAHAAPEPSPIADNPISGHAVPVGQARLVAQIPPRDAILTRNWVGGRPRLPDAMPWPRIDGTDADFIAQIACADLPAGLWDGLGPRTGALAFFVHPETGAATALHLPEVGPPRAAPKPVGRAYFRPAGLDDDALHRLAVRAFPEWAVDVRGPDAPDTPAGVDAADAFFAATGYDLADPAFHPFDWPTMTALAALLAARLPALETGTPPPPDASDELTEALADAAATNRDAAERAREILAIIDESAGQAGFSASDASAVMTALHAIHWSRVVVESDAESGEDRTETITLPLTRHHPDADLWVSDYRALLFDHARHRWCADPEFAFGPGPRAVRARLGRTRRRRGASRGRAAAPLCTRLRRGARRDARRIARKRPDRHRARAGRQPDPRDPQGRSRRRKFYDAEGTDRKLKNFPRKAARLTFRSTCGRFARALIKNEARLCGRAIS